MNPVMYLFGNRGLGMSSGKLAAQVSHAAVEAYIISDLKMADAWRSGGHYAKVLLSADDEQKLHNIQTYIEDRGFKVAPIIDEGRTEITPFSFTALGVAIVDKDDQHVKDTFGTFKLYKELPQQLDELDSYASIGLQGHLNRQGKHKLTDMVNDKSKDLLNRK